MRTNVKNMTDRETERRIYDDIADVNLRSRRPTLKRSTFLTVKLN